MAQLSALDTASAAAQAEACSLSQPRAADDCAAVSASKQELGEEENHASGLRCEGLHTQGFGKRPLQQGSAREPEHRKRPNRCLSLMAVTLLLYCFWCAVYATICRHSSYCNLLLQPYCLQFFLYSQHLPFHLFVQELRSRS